MPSANSLYPDAVNLAFSNLQLDSDGSVLRSALQDFNAEWSVLFDPQSLNERTVLNWIIPLTEAAGNAPATAGDDLGIVANATMILNRMLYATYTAEAAGRISAGQAADVLAAYNTHIAQFP